MARGFHVELLQGGPIGVTDVEVSPGAVRRRLAREGARILESTLVFHRLPGVVVQWEVEGGTGEVGLHLGWSVPPEARTELPGGPAGPLILHDTAEVEDDTDAGIDSPIRVEVAGGEGRWTVESPGPLTGTDPVRGITRISLHASLEKGDPLTLLFSLDSGDERQRTAILRRLSALPGELESWAAADARGAEGELSLSIDDPRANEAFQWERRRLHAAVGHTGAGDVVLVEADPPAPDGSRLGRVGHGLLALGCHREAGELVERAVSLLEEGLDADPGRLGEAEAADLLLLLGRYVLWTGDPRPLRTVGEKLEWWFTRLKEPQIAAPGSPSSRSSVRPAAVEAALRECAEAVEAEGDRSRAEALRSGGESSESATITDRSPGIVRRASSGAREDIVDPATLLFGLLGARADAFFGRLRLAPRLPDAWRRASVGGIRMGEARVRLAYHVQGGRHTFRLEPTGGRVPVNLVFEPLLPVRDLGGAWVDGSRADVDRFRRGDRVGARLQIPLDAPREVAFEEAETRTEERRGWT